MDFLGDISLPTLISTVLAALFGIWGGAKMYFKKIWTAVDEAEVVLTTSAELMKEVADVPASFLELAEIKEAADVANLPPAAVMPTRDFLSLRINEDMDEWAKLVEVSPRSAISEAWRWVENAMRETAEKLNIPQSDTRSPTALIRELGKREALNSETILIISDLRGIRNRAVHGIEPGISRADAIEYISLVRRIIATLRK